MKTLAHWRNRLTAIPCTIECPEVKLFGGHDHQPPIFVGPGRIDILTSTSIEFTMHATPTDTGDAIRRLRSSQENPYETFEQFRLRATDYEGTKWNGGWTSPELKGLPRVVWPLTGHLQSLLTSPKDEWVSKESGVELVFDPPLRLPMDEALVTVATVGGEEVQRKHGAGQQVVPVLGSEIRFFHEPGDDALWVTAKTTKELPHPCAENWLSEPLRVLLGQLVFPRLVARNFGDGSAQVWLRPSPPHLSGTGLASFLGADPRAAREEFWDLYAHYLSLVAGWRDDDGHQLFEANPVTRYYEEIIQATQGSRWVLCFTLASTAEGLARMLLRPDEERSDFQQSDLDELLSHISAWDGNKDLRERIAAEVRRAGQRTIGRYLRDLVQTGVVEHESERAWAGIRHSVAHGNLVIPWATQESDKKLEALAGLVHSLTRELLRRRVEIVEESNAGLSAPREARATPEVSGVPDGGGEEERESA